MKSLTPLATVLIAMLWAPFCMAETGSTADAVVLSSPAEASTTAVESTYESPASENPSFAGPIPANDQLTEILQTLSPLPVLALGILGLFWVRRHTAEL
ncbi:MAG: hypothetical protein OES38_20540 [Gammaproteobacteria bacterium]|nr:hypothetical protein [Gammaproteobacteria bacterium]